MKWQRLQSIFSPFRAKMYIYIQVSTTKYNSVDDPKKKRFHTLSLASLYKVSGKFFGPLKTSKTLKVFFIIPTKSMIDHITKSVDRNHCASAIINPYKQLCVSCYVCVKHNHSLSKTSITKHLSSRTLGGIHASLPRALRRPKNKEKSIPKLGGAILRLDQSIKTRFRVQSTLLFNFTHRVFRHAFSQSAQQVKAPTKGRPISAKKVIHFGTLFSSERPISAPKSDLKMKLRGAALPYFGRERIGPLSLKHFRRKWRVRSRITTDTLDFSE